MLILGVSVVVVTVVNSPLLPFLLTDLCFVLYANVSGNNLFASQYESTPRNAWRAESERMLVVNRLPRVTVSFLPWLVICEDWINQTGWNA